jgi:hypothetical protein
MGSARKLSMRKTVFLRVCCLLALAGVAHAGDTAQLNGSWNFNPGQSDDAQQKVQQAQQAQNSGQPGNSRSYPGGGGYPGQGGGYPGGAGYPGGGGGMGRGGMGTGVGRPGMGNSGAGVSNQEWSQLAANPKYLNISQPDGQIMVTDSDHTRTFYPDGKKHKSTDENGNKISTKTEWKGNELVAETKTDYGKVTETYQVSSDGKQLTVVSRYENSSLSEPLSIRRVYDLGNVAP